MAITQIGPATASQELLDYIRNFVKEDLNTSNLRDFPTYLNNNGKFMGSTGSAGNETIQWLNLPPSGLVWSNADADIDAVESSGYLVSGGITITLPADPTEGTIVALADDKGVLDSDPVTVDGNGKDINGDAENLVVDIRNAAFQMIYDGDEWRITQLNNPVNVSQITEESFAAGQTQYTLSRVPPTTAAILVTENGSVIPSNTYSLNGNVMTFSSARTQPISVRYMGLPPTVQLADVPVGTIGFFPKNRIHTGWLYASGGSISRAIYPDLVTYLTGDPEALTAVLPDYRQYYVKGWDDRANRTTPVPIPANLSSNVYGTWPATLEPQNARNAFDNATNTTTRVRYSDKYIGYTFDAAVAITAINLLTLQPRSQESFMPVTLNVESSNNGNDWTTELTGVNHHNGIDDGQPTTMTITSGNSARYWRVVGVSGADSGDGYYWTIGRMVFSGNLTWTPAGEQIDANLTHNHNITAVTPKNVATVTAGTDEWIGTLANGDNVITANTAVSEPSHAEIIICVKAFNTQGGEIANTDVSQLRTEVNRLSTIHQDIFSRDATVSGDWNYTGELTKNGQPVLTAEDGSGKIPWTKQTANFNAVADNGYMVDVTAGTVIATLPATPVANDFIVLADYNGGVNQTNQIQVNAQGKPIMGVVDTFAIDAANIQLTFTFIDDTQGWRLTNGLGESEAPNAIRGRNEYTDAAGRTVFAATYEVGYVDVYYNGRKLSQNDFVATNGQDVVLQEAVDDATDIVEIITYNHVPVTDGSTAIPYKNGLSVRQGLDNIVDPGLFINGYFQVWQRGYGPWALDGASVEQYTADRWVCEFQEQLTGAQAESINYSGNLFNLPGVTRRPRTLRITSNTNGGVNDAATVEQRIEGVESLAGETMTLSMTYRTNLDNGSNPNVAFEHHRFYGTGAPTEREYGTVIQSLGLDADEEWHTTSFTFTIPALRYSQSNVADSYEAFRLWASAGSGFNARTNSLGTRDGYLEIAEMKLEVGEVPTRFVAQYTQKELELCQRYYWIYRNTSEAVVGTLYGKGDSAPYWAPTFEFPVEMRTVPVANLSPASTFRVFQQIGYDPTGITMSGVGMTRRSPGWGGLTFPGIVFGDATAAMVLFKGGENGFIEFDAEL